MTDESADQAPDERALREHLTSARFQAGVDAGWWRLVTCEDGQVAGRSSLAWPYLLIAVSAASRTNAPDEFVLRFDLNGYPQAAPTAGLWDCETGALLAAERRPKGDRAGRIFRADWEGGRALYAPYDRVAADHGTWTQEHPRYIWHPKRDLTFYLTNVFDLLNDDDYVGV